MGTTDLTSRSLIVLKGLLFLSLSLLSGCLLALETPHWKTAVLVVVLAWSSSNATWTRR